MAVADDLRELQRIDTEADQLRHRLETLPEREGLQRACTALTDWESKRTAMRSRLDELATAVDDAERRAEELGREKQRLEGQLKTVIAPREAEALMHEIETVGSNRDDVEVAGITALEEQADLDTALSMHLGLEESLRLAARTADEALATAASSIDAQLETLDRSRTERRDAVGDGVVARYDRIRGSQGVAVGHLDGHRCSGCHLDLSAAEIDEARDQAAAAEGVADCPNCGRILIVDPS